MFFFFTAGISCCLLSWRQLPGIILQRETCFYFLSHSSEDIWETSLQIVYLGEFVRSWFMLCVLWQAQICVHEYSSYGTLWMGNWRSFSISSDHIWETCRRGVCRIYEMVGSQLLDLGELWVDCSLWKNSSEFRMKRHWISEHIMNIIMHRNGEIWTRSHASISVSKRFYRKRIFWACWL